jgi:protein phosphatase
MKYIVQVYATSHVGRVRKGNEDNYLLLDIHHGKSWTSSQSEEQPVEVQNFEVTDDGIILAVSDGMGGALAGEVASRLAVETVCERLLHQDLDATLSPIEGSSLIAQFFDATLYANHLIHQEQRNKPELNGMGATFTGIAITPQSSDFIQVGDSRAYIMRETEIEQVTKDQSLVQQLVDAQQIAPEEAETHALRNVILQALGAQSELTPVSSRYLPKRGDVLLLCSDGLSNKLKKEDIFQIVTENIDDLSLACKELIAGANQRGGEDNITVVLAHFTGNRLTDPNGDKISVDQLEFPPATPSNPYQTPLIN